MKQTKRIALGGIMSALCVVIMMIGAIIGLGVYVAPMIAGICLIPTGKKYGKGYHTMLWIIVSILSILLVPDIEEGLMFLCLFGLYPIVQPYFQRLPRIARLIVKLLYFNVVIIAVEAFVMILLVPEAMPPVMMAVLLVLGNVTFILYDAVIPRAERLLDSTLGRIIKMSFKKGR